MRLEETIFRSIVCYPSISLSRADVLNHLFYVIGNGYEWVNGQLVAIRDEEKNERFSPHGHIRKEPWDRLISEASKRFRVEYEDSETLIKYDAAVRARWMPPGLGSPENSYSKINNIPDDIQDDWWLGALQAKHWHDTNPEWTWDHNFFHRADVSAIIDPHKTKPYDIRKD